jgi:hypothetical protein
MNSTHSKVPGKHLTKKPIKIKMSLEFNFRICVFYVLTKVVLNKTTLMWRHYFAVSTGTAISCSLGQFMWLPAFEIN